MLPDDEEEKYSSYFLYVLISAADTSSESDRVFARAKIRARRATANEDFHGIASAGRASGRYFSRN